MKKQMTILMAIVTILLFSTSVSNFAQSKTNSETFSLSLAKQNLWLANVGDKFDVTNIPSNSLFAENSDSVMAFPKPDFSAMNKWFEIVKYEYGDPAEDRTLYIWAKRIKERSPAGFVMEFRDKDGVLVDREPINDYTLNSTSVGNVAKTECHTPTETQFRNVETVTVVRIVD